MLTLICMSSPAVTGPAQSCEAFVLSPQERVIDRRLREAYADSHQIHELSRLFEAGGRSPAFVEDSRWDDRFIAALFGDEARFIELMMRTPDTTARDRLGRTLLHYAALGGNQAIVTNLLRSDADVSAVDDLGRDAVHFAVAGGSTRVLDLLIKAGLSLRKNGNGKKPLLFYAAKCGALEMVKYLVRKGAPLAPADKDEATIFSEVDLTAEELISWLLSKNVGFRDDRSCRELAARVARTDSREVVERISRLVSSRMPDWHRRLWSYSVSEYRANVIEYLAKKGSLPDAWEFDKLAAGATIYFYGEDAAQREAQYRRILKLLVQNGAAPGKQHLNAVARKGYFELARLFLSRGADADAMTLVLLAGSGERDLVDMGIARGATPTAEILHGAARSGNLELFKYLEKKYGLQISERSVYTADSPLQQAILGNNPDLAAYLLGKGAVPSSSKNYYQRNDFHTLLEVCDEEMIRLLIQRFNLFLDGDFRDINTYYIAANSCSPRILRLLMITQRAGDMQTVIDGLPRMLDQPRGEFFSHVLEHPEVWDPRLVSMAKTGALAVALYFRNDERVDELIKKYPVLDKSALTPAGAAELLNNAIERGNTRLICYLISNGVSISEADSSGQTPLMLAIKHGSDRFVRYLLDKGADVSARGKSGSVVIAAAGRGDLALFKRVMNEGHIPDDAKIVNDLFFEAARKARLDIVKYLVIEKGAEVNTVRYGHSFVTNSLLLYSDNDELLPVVSFALEHGLDLNFPNGFSLFSFLIENYDEAPKRTLALMDFFIRKGARLTAPGDAGQPPLFSAVSKCFVKQDLFRALIDLLLKNGAKIDATGANRESILGAAKANGCPASSIKYLRRRGAR